jgi:uncharacterized protein (TIGR02646 family)
MLYIEKEKAEKAILDDIATIKRTSEWKNAKETDTIAIRSCFDQLPKDKIRRNLLKEQHYLCAYCMKRINDSSMTTSIEHWYPLSKNKEKALDYGNMIAVCKGGSSLQIEEGDNRRLCCDAAKGDDEITINPLNCSQMGKIKYTKDGKIYTGDLKLDKDINDVLKLNGIHNSDGSFKCDTSTGLVKGRRDAYRNSVLIIETLSKKGKLTVGMLNRKIEALYNVEMRDEFIGTTIFFLKKKIKSLKVQ